MKPINRLMLIGGGGFVACIGIVQLFRKQVSKEIHGTAIVQEAVDMLYQNKGARYLLGQPIETYSLATYTKPGVDFPDQSGIKVPVKGPKSRGILYISTRPDNEQKKQLHTVQLQVGGDGTKRLVIKKAPEEKSSAS